MSENNNTANKKPRNNRYKKNNRNKKKPAEASAAPSNGAPKKRSNNNRNRRPKALTPAKILQKYDNLLEQHLVARKKFSEVHGRVSGKQLNKVVSNLEKTRKSLHEYRSTLKLDWQQEIIKQRIDLYPPDRQFTTTHNIEPVGDEVSFEGDFPDPHFLPCQEKSWADDTEESSGTQEDYEKYKQSI
jgi:hypothetical protein